MRNIENEVWKSLNPKDRGKRWNRWGAKIRTARKEYKCDICGRIIKKGEKYEYSRKPIHDGIVHPVVIGYHTLHICKECAEIEGKNDR